MFHSLVRNHAFIDGNKRTAVLATIVFYGLNGYWIDVEQGDLVALAQDAAEGLVGVNEIESTLKNWATAIPRDDEALEEERPE